MLIIQQENTYMLRNSSMVSKQARVSIGFFQLVNEHLIRLFPLYLTWIIFFSAKIIIQQHIATALTLQISFVISFFGLYFDHF